MKKGQSSVVDESEVSIDNEDFGSVGLGFSPLKKRKLDELGETTSPSAKKQKNMEGVAVEKIEKKKKSKSKSKKKKSKSKEEKSKTKSNKVKNSKKEKKSRDKKKRDSKTKK